MSSHFEPLGITRKDLGKVFGSEKLARQIVEAGWLGEPVLKRHKLSLYPYRRVVQAWMRIENGEDPCSLKGRPPGACEA